MHSTVRTTFETLGFRNGKLSVEDCVRTATARLPLMKRLLQQQMVVQTLKDSKFTYCSFAWMPSGRACAPVARTLLAFLSVVFSPACVVLITTDCMCR